MRNMTVRKSSAGFSPWLPLDRMVGGFGVAIEARLSSNGNLTYNVEHTTDDIFCRVRPISITRVTTVATVNYANHGMSVGDFVQVDNSGSAVLDGQFSVASVVDQDHYTYTVTNSGAATADAINTRILQLRVTVNSQASAKTASVDTNYAFPPTACRLNVTAYTAGYIDMNVVAAGGI